MFAVLNTGGKQYKVSQGDLIEVEKLESNVGDKVTLDQILMVQQILLKRLLEFMVTIKLNLNLL